jgi:hypothetical protein
MSIQDFQSLHEERVRTKAEIDRNIALYESAKHEAINLRDGFKDKIDNLDDETKHEYDLYCAMFGQDLLAWSEIGNPIL